MKGQGVEMNGIFGSMFDLDRDGQMSPLERALEFGFKEEIEGEDEKDYFWDDDGEDEDYYIM